MILVDNIIELRGLPVGATPHTGSDQRVAFVADVGSFFKFSDTSDAADDGATVLKPSTPPGDAWSVGRWLIVNAAQPVTPLTSDGVGAKAGATVSVVEEGSGALHKTTLTLANTPVSIVSVTTGNGVGGTKVYDFPQGRIAFFGLAGVLSMSIAAAKQADFTDSTPEGDVGIGTVAPANADALGTDATDDDFGTATALAMTAFADAEILVPSEAVQHFDGSATAKDMLVNVLIDAADIDDDVTTEVLVSGTITFYWANLGLA